MTRLKSKSNRDMEGTRNSKVKLMAFNCYSDLRVGGKRWGVRLGGKWGGGGHG